LQNLHQQLAKSGEKRVITFRDFLVKLINALNP